MDAAARQIKLKNRYIVDHGKELYDKYYTGISHKTSSSKGTFDFFSNCTLLECLEKAKQYAREYSNLKRWDETPEVEFGSGKL